MVDAPDPTSATPSTTRSAALVASTANPHVALGVAAAAVLALEAGRGAETLGTSPAWPLLQGAVAAIGLALAWPARERLRFAGVATIGVAFQLLWVSIHLLLGVEGDYDPTSVYPSQGQVLLDGGYPESEYPPGAVALFGLETWIGAGAARTPNALLMIPFQLLCVASIWSLRTQWSPWLATFVSLWPLNAFYWEFRFDLIPAAALLLGLLLADRERWYESGFVLGIGAAVKWTPVLAAVGIAVWLLRTRQLRPLSAHLVGVALPVLLVNVPLLLWNWSAFTAAYAIQNARTITAESFVYLPLRLAGVARPGYWYHVAAEVPAWANRAAPWLTAACVGAVVVCAGLTRTRAGALALAGMAPVVFLLTNRIFSPQFFVIVLAGLAFAAALVARSHVEVLLVAAACAVASTANTILYQSFLSERPVGDVPGWTFISAAAGVPALGVTAFLVIRALQSRPPLGAPA